MKMNICGVLVVAAALAGCTQNGAQRTNQRTARANSSQNPNNYRMLTGSHVPQPVDRPFYNNLSADTPYDSTAREGFSLAPTEPIVGAGGQSLYRRNEPNTGAGPAGEPTVQGASDGATPDAARRVARKPRPKATPTPTPN